MNEAKGLPQSGQFRCSDDVIGQEFLYEGQSAFRRGADEPPHPALRHALGERVDGHQLTGIHPVLSPKLLIRFHLELRAVTILTQTADQQQPCPLFEILQNPRVAEPHRLYLPGGVADGCLDAHHLSASRVASPARPLNAN